MRWQRLNRNVLNRRQECWNEVGRGHTICALTPLETIMLNGSARNIQPIMSIHQNCMRLEKREFTPSSIQVNAMAIHYAVGKQ